MQQLVKQANQLYNKLKDLDGAVVLVNGEMGVGKTTFITQVVKCFLPAANPTSPTFTIVNQYADNIFQFMLILYNIRRGNMSSVPEKRSSVPNES